MDYIGKSFMIKGVLELIVFFIALVLTRSLEISLTVLFVGAVSITHFYDAKKARLFYAPIKPRLASVIQLLRECLPAAIYGLLFTFAGQLPKYFIENQLGTEALGYYSSIAMPVLIIQVSASFIFSPLATPLAESLERHDRDNFIKLIAKVLIAIAALAIAGLSGFFLLGSPFYQMLFSERILPYVYLATPLALCSVLVALSWFLATVLTVMRRLNHLMLFSLVTFLIVLISCIPSIQALGMNGATITYIIALTIFNTLCLLVLSKELKQRSEPNTKKTLEK